MSAKITPEHTRRMGIVYVRQSTASQVRGNLESRRRQYALADHARGLVSTASASSGTCRFEAIIA